ncbi:hypothetical protein J0B03_10090 [Alkalibacter rhizosphaerae]|uniref:Uncharacterized protein n=1 Tax=Alkalibacter rhizosphaerae TaxID=2815577 RepID=A0A975AHZ2_9FIRM|nr:hypothetical protein [Alkalibacter rhizosphaerae]QSX08139.1 hypothetical protein J0B03_10090 [Alkalibacter rhizosphaerae]
MDKEFKPVLTREELIERYNLSEDDQVYLLDLFVEVEQAVYRHLSYHL